MADIRESQNEGFATVPRGQTPAQLFAQIAASPEFAGLHGAQSNADYVASLYQSGLGRAPDPAGGASAINLLDSGAGSRAAVFQDIATSAEAAARLTRSLAAP